MEVYFIYAIRTHCLTLMEAWWKEARRAQICLSYWSASTPEVQTNTFVVKAGEEDELFVTTEYLAVWFYVPYFIVSHFCEDIRIDSYVW